MQAGLRGYCQIGSKELSLAFRSVRQRKGFDVSTIKQRHQLVTRHFMRQIHSETSPDLDRDTHCIRQLSGFQR